MLMQTAARTAIYSALALRAIITHYMVSINACYATVSNWHLLPLSLCFHIQL